MSDAITNPPEDGNDDPLIGTVVAERYRIDAILGAGGMGAVYRAEHIHMRKAVALKVLHAEMTVREDAVKRFEREAMAAGRIEHPNVTLATDFGRLSDGSFYLVLEYIPGRTLRETIDVDGALPLERALIIARQIAGALGAAHAAEIVHRDLKPDNVMLIERGGTKDFVKVLDFGIAKLSSESGTAASQLTRVGTIFGTPQYMAPEQAAGRPVDHRVDLYALGLIFHEMLTGKPTFQSEDIIGLLAMQMTQPAPALPATVPTAVSDLVMQLLQKDPEQRVATADELAQRIDALLGPLATSFDLSAGLPTARRALGSVATSPALPRIQLPSSLNRVVQSARSIAERAAGSRAVRLAMQRLRGHIWIKGRRIPVWTIVAALCAVLVVVFWPSHKPAIVAEKQKPTSSQAAPKSGAPHATDEADDEDSEEANSEPLDPELERVITAARRGDSAALYALQLRKEDQRTPREWVAIAVGRLKKKELKASLTAYEEALERQPSVASDKTMLGGLRYLADKDDYAKDVLNFAAEHLGSQGADLIFHAWASTSRVTITTQTAKELLDSPKVRDSMSDALRLAIAVREAKTCEDFKKLLPELETKGDDRSYRTLRELTRDDGCGEDKRSDCYPCLRGDSKLKDAIVQVQMRKAPRFELPRRWRWR